MDGNAEAHRIKLACSEPPEGHARWTLHFLADELVTLDEIDFESISHETLRQRLKNTLKPHFSDYWAIPSENDADFVYHMEDVLDLYHEPYDETRPVICFDEYSKALRGHENDPLPAKPGAVARVGHRYERKRTDSPRYRTADWVGERRDYRAETYHRVGRPDGRTR